MPDASPTVAVTAADRRHLRLPLHGLLANKLHEFWIKGTGRRIPGQGMIGAGAEAVAAGFGSLRGATFDAYNYPQVWVESRMIPQVLDGRVPAADACVVDLGCGPGSSTQLISWFARPAWRIIGYELIEHQVEEARRRSASGAFVNRAGETLRPTFHCQSVAETLREEAGPLADHSVDLAVSGGVVGLYLTEQQGAALLAELKRIIRPGGFIALDAGPAIPEARLRELAEQAGFAFRDRVKSFVIEPRPKLVFAQER